MATTNSNSVNYTNLAEIKNFWISRIAPNYFDLDNINNYNIGIFGYINEVMATTTEDAFNATAIARREFYPVTAQYKSSLYDMATLQSIEIPMVTPAVCKAALIIPQDEIIENSTYNNGVYECTIDSCLKIFADDLQFMLDYPIIIISRKTDKWVHTVHYDLSVSNSLNTTPDSKYIGNTVLNVDGRMYVVLMLNCIRQLQMEEISKILVKDSVLDTTVMEYDFDGDLANFEVFYKETSNAEELQLKKVLANAATPSVPYVQYKLVNPNKIQLIFAYNGVFNPKFNSEIIVRVYTSEGKDGNFNKFTDNLMCSSDSEKFPYNANMTIMGKVNGSATGGRDQMLDEDFRNKILKAYATNNTITTSNDLQLQFDDIASDISNIQVLFNKKRDDALIRLFGAYSVYKDEAGNVIPTNTLDIELLKSDFVPDLGSVSRIAIPPGTVFEYKAANSYVLVPAKKADGTLKTVLDVSEEMANANAASKMYFTNPFMMGININPNNIGYYQGSFNKQISTEYTYVNDSSPMQFIGSSLSMYRNTMHGSNYYKFELMLSPASEMDYDTIAIVNDPEVASNQIRAAQNGRVIRDEFYHDTTTNENYVRYVIQYADGSIIYIQASNTLPIGRASKTGYKMNYDVGDSFIANAILATKRCNDAGNLVIAMDVGSQLYANSLYIPMSVQEIDPDNKKITLEGYISTNDEIDSTEKITIVNGIYNNNGDENTMVAIPMKNFRIELNTLFNNDSGNILNKYTSFSGLNNFTLTNTYLTSEEQPLDFIDNLQFIRSTVTFSPGGTRNGDFMIVIKESPVIGAAWASEGTQFEYFIEKYAAVTDRLDQAYYQLENNFSIDSKFYNTYGKARFYTVGNSNESMGQLDSVRCNFHFGVSLTTVSSSEQFITRFRAFIQKYIESDITVTSSGQDLYIMNMISELKKEFSEIAYLEYYGFNTYDYSAQKVLGPESTSNQSGYIPEFLNVNIKYDSNGEAYPDITVDILN